MFAKLDVFDSGVDGVVVGPGDFLSITFTLGVERVDVRRASAKPQQNAGIGLAFG